MSLVSQRNDVVEEQGVVQGLILREIDIIKKKLRSRINFLGLCEERAGGRGWINFLILCVATSARSSGKEDILFAVGI